MATYAEDYLARKRAEKQGMVAISGNLTADQPAEAPVAVPEPVSYADAYLARKRGGAPATAPGGASGEWDTAPGGATGEWDDPGPSMADMSKDVARSFASGVRGMVKSATGSVAEQFAFDPNAPGAAEILESDESPERVKELLRHAQQQVLAPRRSDVDEFLEPRIPEEQVGSGLRRAKKAAEIAGTYAFPGSLGGKGVPALMKAGALAGGITGGTTGSEMKGDTGELVGTILGDLAGGNAKGAAIKLYKGFTRGKVARLGSRISRLAKGGATLDNATRREMEDAVEHLGSQLDFRGKTPDEAEKYLQKVFDDAMTAKMDNPNLTLGQILDDRGLISFETTMQRGATGEKATKAQVFAANEMDAMRSRLAEETIEPVRRLSRQGKPEGLAKTMADKTQTEAADIADAAEQMAIPLVAAGETGLKQARATQARVPMGQSKKMLQSAAPEGTVISEGGQPGFKQLSDAVSAQYDAAWKGAGKVPQDGVAVINDDLDELIKFYAKSDEPALYRLKADIEKLASDPAEAMQLGIMDRKLRAAAGKAKDRQLQNDLLDVKKHLRKYLPEDAQKGLKAADAGYPDYLTAERASAAASAEGGAVTAKQIATAGRSVAGRRRAARGEAPLAGSVEAAKAAEATSKAGVEIAQDTATYTREQAKALRKHAAGEIKDVEASGPGILAAAEPGQYRNQVKAVMKDKQRTMRVTELVESTATDPTARDGLRRAFAEELQVKVSKEGVIDKGVVDDFNEMRSTYEKSGLFTSKELDSIKEGLVEGQKMYLHDAKELARIPAPRRWLLNTIAAITGAKIGAAVLGSPLIGAATGRAKLVELVETLTTKTISDLAYELTVNPGKFKDIIAKLNKSPKTQKDVDGMVAALFKRSAPAGGRVAVGQEEE